MNRLATTADPTHAPTTVAGGQTYEVTDDLACLPQSIANLYFYGKRGAADRQWVLVDAGLPTTGRQVARAAADRYGEASRPAAIVLTHGHFDHVGDVVTLAEQWDAPVYVHPLELPYVTGLSSYPPPDPAVGGGAMSFLSRLYPRGPIDLGHRARRLPEDGSVPGMPGWQWVFTPGHSPGHVSFFRAADKTLIAGDAFVTLKQESAFAVLTRKQEVRRPPAYYTADWGAAQRSVEKLAALRPEIAATGHGVPMFGEPLRQGLGMLVADWDRVAVPSHGRYVDRPAVTDARGIVSLPPPVTDPALAVVLGVGLATVVGTMLVGAGQRKA